MEEKIFQIQGSAADPYEVRFIRRTAINLSASCTCSAGVMGQYCKHRFAVIAGDTSGLVSGNEADVAVVRSWIAGTDVEAAMRALAECEQQLALAKRRVSAAKKQVAATMRD